MRVISQSNVGDEGSQSRLDEEAEQEDRADDDGKAEQIGRPRGGLDIESDRAPERGDEPADEAAGTGIVRDKRADPGGDEHRHGNRQKGANACEQGAQNAAQAFPPTLIKPGGSFAR